MAGLETAAFAYAERLGWSVFPCRGKIPAIAGGRGCLDATNDLAVIQVWWREYPDANIGVATGGRSGLWVLDVDGDQGWTSLKLLERDHGPLPASARQVTGSGEHIIFAHDPARPVRNRTAIRPGLDVRGDGGYVVVAPSVHPETERTYRWHPDYHPLRTTIATAPGWLLDLVTADRRLATERPSALAAGAVEGHWGPKPAYSRAALEGACQAIVRAPIGQQDATLNGEAFAIGRLVASGHMPRGLAFRLLEWAGMQMTNAAARRPWKRSEIQEKIARAFLDAEHHPRVPQGRTA